jgi:hypothetical protein
VTCPLDQAAANAWDEAAALAADARLALALAAGPAGHAAARDAVNAWSRAVGRAQDAQRLADHDAGAHNAWAVPP